MAHLLQKYAFVFPGQGSQAVGMLSQVAKQKSIVYKIFTKASEVLGYDLWHLVEYGPEEKLNQTQFTQPALLAAGVAAWSVCKEQATLRPICMAGHSLGEYTALVCADAIKFEDAIQLVANRGKLMQEAVPEGKGAMLAIIGLENDVINAICQSAAKHHEVLAPANYNAHGQTVLSGDIAAIERALSLAQKAHAKVAKILKVSAPSHCFLMKKAAEQLALELAKIEICAPHFPILHNVDVLSHEDSNEIRDALVTQLYQPVRWVEIIERFADMGVVEIIECGPGKVLAGLNKRIIKDIPTISFHDLLN